MRKDIVIFRGPSIPLEQAKTTLDAIYLPPAKQGDMYKAYLKYKPKKIGLIDGIFENCPAPWHKEILFIMSKNVEVFGSSSMGALRASELDRFGMKGIGQIYKAYATGVYEDDDEVAILHGPAELDYIPLSNAMVDIRETIKKAVASNIITPTIANEIIYFSKTLFYKERQYKNILAHGYTDKNKINNLKNWLDKFGDFSLKKNDACELLKQIQKDTCNQTKTSFELNNTVFWNNMKKEIDKQIKIERL